MKDISYEILDLFKTYGSTREGMDQALDQDERPQVLHALSPIRENLLEWLDLTGQDQVLELGSGYGVFTGLLAGRCAHVTVVDDRDENLLVNRQRNQARGNITYGLEGGEDLTDRGNLEGQEPLFDWVFLVGPGREEPLEETVRRAGGYLKDGGRFVFACENAMGLRFLAGGGHDGEEASYTKGRLMSAFHEAGFTSMEFYYPMPDYRLPASIYSDRYLPGKGSITHMDVSYDRPRYACLNEEEVYDMLLEEGDFSRFSNGFLLIASKGAPLQKTVYVKYNRTRKQAFQIRTSILEEDGTRYVEKAALSSEGSWHILSFAKKYDQLKAFNPWVRVLEPLLSEDGMTVRFRFLEGITLAEKLGSQIRNGKAPLEEIRAAMKMVFDVDKDQTMPFTVTPEFTEVFGEIPDIDDISYKVSNIDGLFENLMLVKADAKNHGQDGQAGDERLYCLDYEWVFDFPVPAHFVQYRNLAYFYYKYQGLLQYAGLEDFLEEFSISRQTAALYASMEEAFQSYVHGDGSQGYLARYSQKVTGLGELMKTDEELTKARDRIHALQAEVEEKNFQIRKEQEVQRLTNNHVANLEVMIKDLRHEIDELGRLATYLNGHEALIFKVRRKLGAQVNKAFPKGTKKRKVLNYCFNTVKHPIRYGRLYATRSGRNQIDGDFKIGEDYLKYGRLVFPQVPGPGGEGPDGWDGPQVSIVIPCYNQVHYTYACLQSILEFTKDVTYEVIIADDVSTDATACLGQYVEGLVICRNETNQGFLKNCNQAARAARGKYIMFLNNDTKVTHGWLSSLVDLIESDRTIGMVGSKLVYPDGRLQEAGGIIWSDGSGWNYGRLDDPDKAEYNSVKDVDYISGAAILLSSALWKQIGGFDQRYAPAYCEDSDLAFEVRRAGYRVVYQPLSKVIHFEGVSNGTDVNGTGLKRYQVENSRKLKEKWAEELKGQCVNTGSPNPFRARERSQGKEIILVVDHYVPTFDKDAGSKTTYQYLKMFLKKGYVVKFLGDNFLHEEPYSTTLQQMGIEVLYGDDYAAGIWDWLKTNGDQINYAYLNRPHIAAKYVDYIKDYTKMKVIYYGHDLHFLRLGREYELTGDIHIKREADYWKSVELTMMHKAAVSYYPSYVEINAIHAIDGSIHAKAITAYVYDTFLSNIQDDFAKREGLLFVGGFAHPPNADAVLWFAREIFPAIRKRIPGIRFYVVGSKVTGEIQALGQEEGIVIKGFVSEEELKALYSACKLVVVPLRYGAGVKGKVVEAIYHGAPIVTTSTGAEGIPFVESVLEIADEPEAFADRVAELYNDNGRCQELCRRTQDYIKKNFSMDGAWKVIDEDFRV